jgi:hypothetical protein
MKYAKEGMNKNASQLQRGCEHFAQLRSDIRTTKSAKKPSVTDRTQGKVDERVYLTFPFRTGTACCVEEEKDPALIEAPPCEVRYPMPTPLAIDVMPGYVYGSWTVLADSSLLSQL